MTKFVGFIPARKDSRRIPNKNLIKFKKKPLIFYSIIASIKCKYISETIIFSNSKKINSVGKKYGAVSSFIRPNKVSRNKSTMFSTINYFIKKYNIKKKYDYLILLQPTSPLRTTKDINRACEIVLKNKKADGLLSTFVVKKLKKEYPNKFMVLKKNYLKKIDKKNIDLKNNKVFLRNGPSIFIIKIKSIKKDLYKNKLLNFVLPENRSLDLNTNEDLQNLKKRKMI